MATKQPKGKTHFNFLAPNNRAEIIGTVAAGYSDDDIMATITPLSTREEGESAFTHAFPSEVTTGVGFLNRDMDSVLKRFGDLGEAGLHSLVRLDVPQGGQSFDLVSFYERVNELQNG